MDKITEANKGNTHSEETKRKISANQQGVSLEDWKGFVSFEPYTTEFNKRFKTFVKERDGCCMLCNVNFEDLLKLKRDVMVHHIDYNKLNSFKENCVALCNNCHSITNTNRSHWKTFFQSLLKERYGYQYTEDQKIILDFIGVKK